MDLTNLGAFLNDFVVLALWLYLTVQISTWLDMMGLAIFPGIIYRILITPGVVVHELSHALFCVLTGASIQQINFFDREGGSVTHDKPKLPFGQVLISIAPLPCILVVINWLISIFPGSIPKSGQWQGIDEMFIYLWESFTNLKMVISGWESWNWQDYLVFYCMVSCVACMSPSKSDMKNCMAPVAGLLVIYLGVEILAQIFWGKSVFVSYILPISALITLSLTLQIGLILVLALPAILAMVFKKNKA